VLEDFSEVRSALRPGRSQRSARRAKVSGRHDAGARGLRTQGTVCFDQLFTGINHLFPTLVVRQRSYIVMLLLASRLPLVTVCSACVGEGSPSEVHTTVRRPPVQSSRVFTDHRVVGDAKPAELNSEINQGTARSIFRRVLRGLELKPVRSRAFEASTSGLGSCDSLPGSGAAKFPLNAVVTPYSEVDTAAAGYTMSNAPDELHSGPYRPQPDDHLAPPSQANADERQGATPSNGEHRRSWRVSCGRTSC
jgi:hypothetical protein